MTGVAAVAPILVAGFEPFDGAALNPSWEVAWALHGRRAGLAPIVAERLPTVFDLSLRRLLDAVDALAPQMVVCLGLAGGRAAVSLERVAINLIDARIPDNAGRQPVDCPVVVDGPAAYFSTLPVKAMWQALQQAGLPAELSYSAGTFVCNQVLYGLLHHLGERAGASGHVRAGFIHVPWSTGCGTPALPLALMVEGIHAALVAALHIQDDLRVVGGATH